MSDDFDDGLFESTKMTFGEHLDELRAALIKSVLALAIGFLIALIPQISGSVVEYVQTPLKEALAEYYQGIARKDALRILEQQRQRGEPVPEDIEAAAKLIADEGLVPEERFIDPQGLASLLDKVAPGTVDRSKVPATIESATLRDRMLPFVTYHKLEDDPRVRWRAIDTVVGFASKDGRHAGG